MIQTILLARHGAHDEVGRVLSGRSAIALNAAGRAQAAALARQLGDAAIRSIHASPQPRCGATAAAVAARLRMPVTIADGLDEIDFGAFAGRSFPELDRDADWLRWNAARSHARCPGGETMDEAVDRAIAVLDALSEPAMPALCVTHCDIIRGIVARVLGIGFDAMFALPCDPGGVTTLVREGSGALRLVTLNALPPQPADQ